MRLRGSLVVVAVAGGLAWPHGLVAQSAGPHTIGLSSQRVTIQCDDAGGWTRIYATEAEPVAPGDAQAVRAAQKVAEQRAGQFISRFFQQQVPVESVAGDIERALVETAARDGVGPARLSREAQRRLAAGIVESRREYAATNAAGSPLLETGYDTERQMAWARVGVTRQESRKAEKRKTGKTEEQKNRKTEKQGSEIAVR